MTFVDSVFGRWTEKEKSKPKPKEDELTQLTAKRPPRLSDDIEIASVDLIEQNSVIEVAVHAHRPPIDSGFLAALAAAAKEKGQPLTQKESDDIRRSFQQEPVAVDTAPAPAPAGKATLLDRLRARMSHWKEGAPKKYEYAIGRSTPADIPTGFFRAIAESRGGHASLGYNDGPGGPFGITWRVRTPLNLGGRVVRVFQHPGESLEDAIRWLPIVHVYAPNHNDVIVGDCTLMPTPEGFSGEFEYAMSTLESGCGSIAQK